MISTGIPELRSIEDIDYLKEAFSIGLTEEQAANEFSDLIMESIKMGWSTQLNWYVHNLAHK